MGAGCDKNEAAIPCGNGQLDAFEECDDGARNGQGSCTTTCTLARTPSQMRSRLTQAASESCVETLDFEADGPALVFNRPSALKHHFSFERTLMAVGKRFFFSTQPERLVQSMLNTFLARTHFQRTAELGVPVDRRMGEARLNASAMVRGFIPVAAFNRVDLAPDDGSHCGEQRLIFAKASRVVGLPDGRMTIIFEGRYPNPQPSLGRAGCRPIASFWLSLANPNLSDDARASRLASFFFDGITINGVHLPPVLRFEQFTEGMGQIRTNHFIERVKWQLREFNLVGLDDNTVKFEAHPVQDSPIAELFGQRSAHGPADSEIVELFRPSFQHDFVHQQLDRLLMPERLNARTAADINTSFFVQVSGMILDFQSDAQGLSDSVPFHAGTGDLGKQIEDRLPEGSRLTAQHIFNRMHALNLWWLSSRGHKSGDSPGDSFSKESRFRSCR